MRLNPLHCQLCACVRFLESGEVNVTDFCMDRFALICAHRHDDEFDVIELAGVIMQIEPDESGFGRLEIGLKDLSKLFHYAKLASSMLMRQPGPNMRMPVPETHGLAAVASVMAPL